VVLSTSYFRLESVSAMLIRGIARRRSPSLFAIVGAALFLVAYSSGPAGAVVLLLVGLPAAIGGLALYFGCGLRRAVLSAAAILALILVLASIDKALGPGTNGGGGMPPPASAR
jgi:hypothetical protein